MMLKVVAAGHYLHTLREGEALPDLTPALKQVCRERPRRVDRFIELALLGSGLCVRGRERNPGCGIYLGSGFGPMASNVAVQEQIFRDRECPKPFDFMNILGASAGFHVAKNLGLTGQNLFVSRRGASLEAALTLAQADLELGVVSQALVGVVEEVTLPLGEHRRRRGLPADTPVAEGSHWLLLEPGGSAARSLQLRQPKDLAELEEYLQAHYRPGDRCYWMLDKDVTAIAALAQRFMAGAVVDSGIHDCQQAAWLTEFLASGASGNLFLMGTESERGFSLLHLGP